MYRTAHSFPPPIPPSFGTSHCIRIAPVPMYRYEHLFLMSFNHTSSSVSVRSFGSVTRRQNVEQIASDSISDEFVSLFFSFIQISFSTQRKKPMLESIKTTSCCFQ